jgi:hypothetical protein
MTIRDDVILLLLLVLVVKSAAKTHIYYSIYRCCSIHVVVLEVEERESRREFRFCSAPLGKKHYLFFTNFHNEIFVVPAKTRKIYRKGEEKTVVISSFFLTHSHRIRAHTKNHL